MQWTAFVLAVALLTACGPAPAPEQSQTISPQSAASVSPPPTPQLDQAALDAEILTWGRSAFNVEGQSLIEPVDTFYGDFTGDDAADALAFFYYDTGGSSAGLTVALFRNQNGHMTHLRNVDEVLGMAPRDARFERGRVTVTTSVLGPNDPLCCPSKAHQWAIAAN